MHDYILQASDSHNSRFTVIVMAENDDLCNSVLQSRKEDGMLPEVPILPNVTSFMGDILETDAVLPLDGVIAGFACHGISGAGGRSDLHDERSGLVTRSPQSSASYRYLEARGSIVLVGDIYMHMYRCIYM